MIGVSPAYYISKYGSHFTIDNLIGNLYGSGFEGSMDLEIICPEDQVEKEYNEGIFFFK